MRHPREVFEREPEPAVINPENPQVADAHIACAAFELPLSHDDLDWWAPVLDGAVHRLVNDGRLRVRRTGQGPLAVWASTGWPSRGVGLRSGSSREFSIRLADRTLVGTVDEARAFDVVHPGAAYLHRGDTFRVTDLDLDALVATVEADDGREYTQARSTVDIAVVGTDATRGVGASRLHLGDLEVTTTVVGYQRRETRSRKILGHHELELPPQRLVTRGFWYTVDPSVIEMAGSAAADLPGTLHAIEHAAIGILPLFTICDRWDVGGVSTALQADTGLPSIFIYDGYPGGAGIAEMGFEAADRHLHATLDVVRGCGCTDGCPSCVQSPKCGNGNEPLDKHGAIALLECILS
jgi:DEAD/DEAH box helicase domain-containing protein